MLNDIINMYFYIHGKGDYFEENIINTFGFNGYAYNSTAQIIYF